MKGHRSAATAGEGREGREGLRLDLPHARVTRAQTLPTLPTLPTAGEGREGSPYFRARMWTPTGKPSRTLPTRTANRRKCDHPGCSDLRHAGGLCRRHAEQVRRYGRVLDPQRTWTPPGPWVSGAACADDPELMFAEDLQSIAEAKRVCAACPVAAECLAYALDHAEPFGVWGGLTAEERAAGLAGKRAVA